MEVILDGGSDGHSTIWSRLGRFFGHDDEESLEKAILEARADGEVEPDEESMLLGILRFNDLQVQDTMIPRTDIDCVPDDMPLPEVARVIVDSGHSRIPVYKDTRDNMVGILHAKDLLRCLIEPAGKHPPVAQVMREPFFVPETKPIRALLQEFRARKQHIAIALDEYGGTSGLITIEDVLEEIVGDIEDEHDTPRQEDIRPLGDNVYELTGRALLEDLEEILGVLRQMMRCEVLEEAFRFESILGLTSQQLREQSHDPQKNYGIAPMQLPSWKFGKGYAMLNHMRTAVRETESAAAEAFCTREGCSRPDILEGLNRMSSAFHIMMCRYQTGMYQRKI